MILDLFSSDLSIDLGTANTIIFVKNKGLVLDEPSVVSISDEGGKKKVKAVGIEAKTMLGRTPTNIETVRTQKRTFLRGRKVGRERTNRFLKHVPQVQGYGCPPALQQQVDWRRTYK